MVQSLARNRDLFAAHSGRVPKANTTAPNLEDKGMENDPKVSDGERDIVATQSAALSVDVEKVALAIPTMSRLESAC